MEEMEEELVKDLGRQVCRTNAVAKNSNYKTITHLMVTSEMTTVSDSTILIIKATISKGL